MCPVGRQSRRVGSVRGSFSGGTVRSQARIVLVLAGSALLAASAAFAASDVHYAAAAPVSPAACPAQDDAASAETAGTPTPEEIRERLDRWRAERVRILSSLYEIGHRDGSVSVDPQDLFAHEIVMRRNPDGSMSIRCMPSAWKALATAPPVTRPLETR
jgi:hypothetical protein